jgi:SAM-dependent methyltransferase
MSVLNPVAERNSQESRQDVRFNSEHSGIRGRVFNGLRTRRRRLDDQLARRNFAHTFSLARDCLHRALSAAIAQYASGDCLDAGSGRSPYKRLLMAQADSVTSIDVEDRAGEIDLIADIQDLHPFADASFDTILCSQVLEHVPHPWEALSEFARVLRPGGCLVLSVPHLSMIHEAPHDDYRYTRFGLQALSERAGLTVECLNPTGGLFCFLAHNASVVFTSTIGSLPGLQWLCWFVNYVLLVRGMSLVDRVLGLKSVYPCDYLLVARKPLADRLEHQP